MHQIHTRKTTVSGPSCLRCASPPFSHLWKIQSSSPPCPQLSKSSILEAVTFGSPTYSSSRGKPFQSYSCQHVSNLLRRSAAVQPLFGQLSNLFGRRYLTIAIVALFTLGSGICGGANGPAMLIAGRAIQGAGSGGINMIVDIIISDLVPLRDRGNYIAIILVTYGIGTAIGPFVGGIIVQKTSWRWVRFPLVFLWQMLTHAGILHQPACWRFLLGPPLPFPPREVG